MTNLNNKSVVAGSFRDPSGFLFRDGDDLLRQMNHSYKPHYEKLIQSGLYQKLVDQNLLIPHEEVKETHPLTEEGFLVIRPKLIPFISYPYEWCFEQLKEAALTTLRIQKIAFEHGMILKDASAFNIQFEGTQPVLIDSLSFEIYEEGKPWIAYKQFCQHFLAPLALMSKVDARLGEFFRNHIDGIPLDLTSKLLPGKTYFSFALLSHIHLHAKAQERYASSETEKPQAKISKLGLRGLIDNLESIIKKLSWTAAGTEWADYYEDTSYSEESFEEKRKCVTSFIRRANPKSVWDLGANRGVFSRLASEQGISTVAFDVDLSAVQKNFLEIRGKGEKNLLPLVLDLTNPSPSLGWANEERNAIEDRGKPELVMALALIHHLAISNNLPFAHIAKYFSKLSEHLIIEFVPKEDSQVQRLLSTREDIFPDYYAKNFEEAFGLYYTIEASQPISGTDRTLYFFKRH